MIPHSGNFADGHISKDRQPRQASDSTGTASGEHRKMCGDIQETEMHLPVTVGQNTDTFRATLPTFTM